MTQVTTLHKPRPVPDATPLHGSMTPMTATPDRTRDFALAAGVRLRLLGTGVVALGVAAFAVALLVGRAKLPLAVLLVLGVVVLVALVALGVVLVPRRWVVRLDSEGYRTRFRRRTANLPAAPWTDVESVEAAKVGGARFLVIHVAGGRRTVIPVDVIAGSSEDFADAVLDHLETARPAGTDPDAPRARRRDVTARTEDHEPGDAEQQADR